MYKLLVVYLTIYLFYCNDMYHSVYYCTSHKIKFSKIPSPLFGLICHFGSIHCIKTRGVHSRQYIENQYQCTILTDYKTLNVKFSFTTDFLYINGCIFSIYLYHRNKCFLFRKRPKIMLLSQTYRYVPEDIDQNCK